MTIETSWLPNLRLVQEALVPLGFARLANGAWRASAEIDNFIGVARKVTRAIELLLTEATDMISEEDEP